MNAIVSQPLLITPLQAAEELGVSDRAVRGLIASCRIAHVLIGKKRMIPRDAVIRFIAENTVEPVPCPAQTPDRDSSPIESAAESSTSSGPKRGARESGALAREIAEQLKSSSAASFSRDRRRDPAIRLSA